MAVFTATTSHHLAAAVIESASVHATDITQVVILEHGIVLSINATAEACMDALTGLGAIPLKSNLVGFSRHLESVLHGAIAAFEHHLQSHTHDRLAQSEQNATSRSTTLVRHKKWIVIAHASSIRVSNRHDCNI